MVIDEIERSTHVAAPIEQVWEAITQPHHIVEWLSDLVEVDLREGGSMVFYWEEERGAYDAVIEEIRVPHTLVFRWRYEQSREYDAPLQQGNSTRVCFQLTEAGNGTQVQVTESGFASLPARVQAQVLHDNAEGWIEELRELQAYFVEVYES